MFESLPGGSRFDVGRRSAVPLRFRKDEITGNAFVHGPAFPSTKHRIRDPAAPVATRTLTCRPGVAEAAMDRDPRSVRGGGSPCVAAHMPDSRSGFDVKLPIAVTLTGEDRRLYPLNRANATAFSSLARILSQTDGDSTLDFQCDVASIAHADPMIGSHPQRSSGRPCPPAPRGNRSSGAEPLVRATAGAHGARPPSRGAGVRFFLTTAVCSCAGWSTSMPAGAWHSSRICRTCMSRCVKACLHG